MEKCAAFMAWNTQHSKNFNSPETDTQPHCLHYFSEAYCPPPPQWEAFVLLLSEVQHPTGTRGLGRALCLFPWAHPTVKMHWFLLVAQLFSMLWGINRSKSNPIKFCFWRNRCWDQRLIFIFFPKRTPFSYLIPWFSRKLHSLQLVCILSVLSMALHHNKVLESSYRVELHYLLQMKSAFLWRD